MTQALLKVQTIVLTVGVGLSMFLIAFGGIFYVYDSGSMIPTARDCIQGGLFILIGVQLIRLLFVMIEFLIQKDFLWLLMSSFVLAVLLFSLFFHTNGGFLV
jgi:uncharacterized membrane protein